MDMEALENDSRGVTGAYGACYAFLKREFSRLLLP